MQKTVDHGVPNTNGYIYNPTPESTAQGTAEEGIERL